MGSGVMTEKSSIIRPARYNKPACPSCRYFEGPLGADGHCRRFPPTVAFAPGDEGPQPYTMFVAVRANWWCGEFKPKFDVAGNE